MKALAFGEILWDIIDEDAHLGGAPLNFAAHTAQCGGDSAIISRLGKDKLGNEALERVRKLGLDTSFIQHDAIKPTGTVPVTLINGQPEYFITPEVAFDYIAYDAVSQKIDDTKFDVLYFGTLIQRGQSGETLRQLLKEFDFGLRFYDVNFRKDCYNEEIVRFSLANTNIVKLNEDESKEIGRMLFGKELDMVDLTRHLRSEYPQMHHVIFTAGGEGCYVYDKHTLHHIKSEPVHVVDAIGAGDSFSAAFMYTFCKTGDIIKSAQVGNKVGGFVASSSGAIPKYSEEIRNLLSNL